MKIALVDVDGRRFPNLALMRLSAWHKARGDSVEWWSGFTHYDRVYQSKVFTFTPDFDTVIDADEIINGGTGYRDYTSLPPEVEATLPDYSIYPWYDRAVGFLTRGCLDNAMELLRTRHKNGEIYYWLLYYTFLSPQQMDNVEEIVEQLQPHIRDISRATYFRKRGQAVEALSSILWGYSSKDSMALLADFFPDVETKI